jgi:hypothetical protein
MEISAAPPKPPTDALDWASGLLLGDDDLPGFGEGFDDSAMIQDFLSTLEGEKKSTAAADDDDDCVILDGDPDKGRVVVKEEKKPGEKDGSEEEELQVLGEKGEVLNSCFELVHILCCHVASWTHTLIAVVIVTWRFISCCFEPLTSCCASRHTCRLCCRIAIRFIHTSSPSVVLSVSTMCVALTSCCASSHTLSSVVVYVVALRFD